MDSARELSSVILKIVNLVLKITSVINVIMVLFLLTTMNSVSLIQTQLNATFMTVNSVSQPMSAKNVVILSS